MATLRRNDIPRRKEKPDEFVKRYPWQTEESETYPPPDGDEDLSSLSDQEVDDYIRNNCGPDKMIRIIRGLMQRNKENAEYFDELRREEEATKQTKLAVDTRPKDPLVDQQFGRLIVTEKVPKVGYKALCTICMEEEMVYPAPGTSWAMRLAREGKKKCERV